MLALVIQPTVPSPSAFRYLLSGPSSRVLLPISLDIINTLMVAFVWYFSLEKLTTVVEHIYGIYKKPGAIGSPLRTPQMRTGTYAVCRTKAGSEGKAMLRA